MTFKIAIASGKGGTGKTTVATNLAHLAAGRGYRVAYIDCDVEAPNGHLFLRPEIETDSPVTVAVPQVEASLCNHCGECADFCQFHALLSLPAEVLLFPELCHSCGGCRLVCPTGAIAETQRPIGRFRAGHSGTIAFASGELNIGEAKSPPLIREVKNRAPAAPLALIDAPPGTSCPTVESLRGCDYTLLVTEPTPFGLHDLKLAAEMVRLLDIPCGVVINRSGDTDGATLAFCEAQGLEVLARLQDDRQAAEAYSRGALIASELSTFHHSFGLLLDTLLHRIDPARPS